MALAALRQLNIEQDVFDGIIADEGARQEIVECLLFCLENVPPLAEIASELIQYTTERIPNEDGGPGSGNHNHAGIPGQVGGSAPQGMTEAAYQASDATDLLYRMIDAKMASDGIEKSAARKAVTKELRDIGMFDPDKLDEFIRNTQYGKEIDHKQLDKETAIETIRDNVPQNVLDGWFRDADSSYKTKLEHLALTNDELRNAGLNIAFDNYKNFVEDSTGKKYEGSFQDFLTSEIPVYRGQRSENQKYVEGDDVIAFSFDPKVASSFGSHVTETKIRPIDTIGSYQTTGENEILVRREKTPLADRMDGGPGSGNFNHGGRPGEVGGSAPGNGSRPTVNGTDISKSYKGKPDIKSVISAQGFDGLPKVVTKDEFDEAVKASGFIAQRTYSASSQEILDAYRDQLYNGEWYVECSTGGAQYGQGMYCAADYSGKLTDGIKAEIEHYKSLYTDVMDRSTAISTAKQRIEDGIRQKAKNNLLDRFHPYVDGYDFQQGKWKPEFADEAGELKGSNPELYGKVLNQLKGYEEKYDASANSVSKLSTEEIGAAYGFSTRNEQVSYTETMTLDPSARIVTYDDIDSQYKEYREAHSYEDSKNQAAQEVIAEYAGSKSEQKEITTMWKLYNTATTNKQLEKLEALQTKYPSINIIDVNGKVQDRTQELQSSVIKDRGAFAAALGYDAINAEGHGESGSYTVILNRTKTIILKDNGENMDAKDGGIITFQKGDDGVVYAIRDRKVIGWVDVQGSCADSRDDGGPGSGHRNHKGVPGEVGGSLPSGRTESGSKERDEQKLYALDRAVNSYSKGVRATSRDAIVQILLGYGYGDEDDSYDEERATEKVNKMVPDDDGWLDKNSAREQDGNVYLAASDILHSGSDYAKFAYLFDLKGADEALKAAESGQYDKAIKDIVLSSSVESIHRYEGLYDRIPQKTARYESDAEHIKAQDDAAYERFGGSKTAAMDYYRSIEETHRDMSFDDYQLERAWVEGDLGTTSEHLNSKLYSDPQGKLTDSESEIVDMVERYAIPLKEDSTFYRGVGPRFLKGQFDFDGDLQNAVELVGKETTVKALSSAGPGVSHDWRGSRVIVKMNAAKGTKVFFPDNASEGETIFTRGLTMKVVSAKYDDSEIPIWFPAKGSGTYTITPSGNDKLSGVKQHLTLEVEVR